MKICCYFGAQAVDEREAHDSKQSFVQNKGVRDNSRTIVTLSAIFSFRKGLIIAKMPLKILGSLIMLTALIRIGNPSCELEEQQKQSQLVLVSRFTCVLCAYVNVTHSAVMTNLKSHYSK